MFFLLWAKNEKHKMLIKYPRCSENIRGKIYDLVEDKYM